jgi:predicted TIM-barrel fold metal-dependent hydrolase
LTSQNPHLEFKTTTPMRAADTLTRPSFTMPAGSCDTHVHIFEPGYPSIPNPHYSFPEGTLAQYLQLSEVLGIQRMVLVQPTYYGEDSSLIRDALAKLGTRSRAVTRIDGDASECELDRDHELGVRGIRLDLFDRASWTVKEIIAYIAAMAARAAPRGWHLQFYAPGTIVRDLLPFLSDFDHPFVIDHMGYFLEGDALTELDFERLLTVLEGGRCWIKLSGPYRIAGSKPLSSVEPIGQALVAARPDRLLWGSDWPHLPDGQRDTGEILNLLADWAHDEQDRHSILVDGPRQLFWE